MSLAVATPHYGFGFRPDVAGSLKFCEEQTLLFPTGNQITRLNLEQKNMKFIGGSDTAQNITAMALSPNNRYLAVAETTVEQKATITVYDLLHEGAKKRKVLSNADLQSTEFVSIAFSPDSKYLAAQSSSPDWTIFLWVWEKNKLLTTSRTCNPVGANAASVTQISFSPQDNTLLAVSGKNVLKTLRFHEGALKQQAFHKLEPQLFTQHCWIGEERLVIGNEAGQVHILDNGELKNTLNLGTQTIGAVAGFSRGFIAGCGGTVHVYELIQGSWRRAKRQRTHMTSDETTAAEIIVAITASPSEESIICGTDSKQLYTGALSVADIQRSGDQISTLDYLTGGFHSGSITGLSCAVRKPLVATSSNDRTVRVWNYSTNTIEFWKDFSEEVYTVSIHPAGHQLLAGFSDKLRLLNILIDDFRVVREFPIRGCREVSFSNGGHLFAAVHGNIIQTFSTVTFEPLSNMKGHNGRVRSVVWSSDDQKIISCGTDGAVYEWEVATGKRLQEQVLKGTQYTSAVLSNTGKAFATSVDGTLREILEGQVLRAIELPGSINGCALSRSGKLLLSAFGGNSGASSGAVVGVRVPLTQPPELQVTPGHAGAITRVQMNHEESLLFTGGEDGLVMIWKISDREGRVKASAEPPIFFEEVLVTRSDLEEKTAITEELKTRVEELKMENEYQLRLKDMNYNEKLKELTEKFILEMESLKSKNQLLKIDKEKDSARYEETFKMSEDKHNQEKVDLEASSNQKLMQEYEKYQELLNQKHKMEEQFQRKESETEQKHNAVLQELEDDYEKRLADKARQLEDKGEESRRAQKEHQEERRQIEEDVDREILGIKDKYERKLKQELDTNMRLKGETGILRKKFSNLQREIEKGQEEQKSAELENGKLQAIIRSLEKDIVGLKHEIMERDETIQEKEKRTYDLKKKNQELEKFKFVLDYKIKELKKQIEPREREIRANQEQIHEMESELERFHKSNTQLELALTESRQKLRAVDLELEQERLRVRDSKSLNTRILVELHDAVGYIQDPPKLKETVRTMYEKYGRFTGTAIQGVVQELDAQAELVRQREYLERNLSTIRDKLKKDSEIHRQENLRVLQDNTQLLQEINVLRRELKSSRTHTHSLETELGLRKRREKKEDEIDEISPKLVEKEKTIELQMCEIRRLNKELKFAKNELEKRPQSGPKLPPIEA